MLSIDSRTLRLRPCVTVRRGELIGTVRVVQHLLTDRESRLFLGEHESGPVMVYLETRPLSRFPDAWWRRVGERALGHSVLLGPLDALGRVLTALADQPWAPTLIDHGLLASGHRWLALTLAQDLVPWPDPSEASWRDLGLVASLWSLIRASHRRGVILGDIAGHVHVAADALERPRAELWPGLDAGRAPLMLVPSLATTMAGAAVLRPMSRPWAELERQRLTLTAASDLDGFLALAVPLLAAHPELAGVLEAVRGLESESTDDDFDALMEVESALGEACERLGLDPERLGLTPEQVPRERSNEAIASARPTCAPRLVALLVSGDFVGAAELIETLPRAAVDASIDRVVLELALRAETQLDHDDTDDGHAQIVSFGRLNSALARALVIHGMTSGDAASWSAVEYACALAHDESLEPLDRIGLCALSALIEGDLAGPLLDAIPAHIRHRWLGLAPTALLAAAESLDADLPDGALRCAHISALVFALGLSELGLRRVLEHAAVSEDALATMAEPLAHTFPSLHLGVDQTGVSAPLSATGALGLGTPSARWRSALALSERSAEVREMTGEWLSMNLGALILEQRSTPLLAWIAQLHVAALVIGGVDERDPATLDEILVALETVDPGLADDLRAHLASTSTPVPEADLRESLSAFEQTIRSGELDPDDAPKLMAWAEARRRQGADADSVLDALELAVTLADTPAMRRAAARICALLGRPQRASEHAQAVLAHDLEDGEAWATTASALMMGEAWDAAFQAALLAVRHAPKDALGWMVLAGVAGLVPEGAGLSPLLEQGAALHSDNAQLQLIVATRALVEGRPLDARRFVIAALEEEPNADVWQLFAHIECLLGEWASAYSAAEVALQWGDESATVYVMAAAAAHLELDGDVVAALALLSDAELSETPAEILSLAGESAARLGANALLARMHGRPAAPPHVAQPTIQSSSPNLGPSR